MNKELFKDLMLIIDNTSNRISTEQVHYEFLLEDFQGLCLLLDNLVDTLDKHMGGDSWIAWYVFDNNMGTTGLTVDNIQIDTVDKLYSLITKEHNATY